MMRTVEGATGDGTRVYALLPGNVYKLNEWNVYINGQRVEVTRANLYRDGGTVVAELANGMKIRLPRSMSITDHRPRLIKDGYPKGDIIA